MPAVLLVTAVLLSATAQAADTIYWGQLNTSLTRMGNLDGSGSASTLFGSPDSARGIGIDGSTNRIFLGNGNGDIRVGGLDGTAPITLISGQFPIGLTIDTAAEKLYWANFIPGEIRTGGFGGGSASTLYGGESGPKGIAIDPASGKLYWADQSGGTIRVGDVNGTPAATLFGGESSPEGVAIDPAAGKIYWGAGSAIRVGNLDGSGTASTLYGSESSDGIAIDVAAGKIYWASTAASWVRVANLNGSGSPQTLFQDPAGTATAYPAIVEVPVPAGPPNIDGAGVTGKPLTCGKGSYEPDQVGSFLFRTPGSFAYEWKLDGATVPGATAGSFTPTAAGSYTCTVTGSDAAGTAAPQTSAALAVAQATAPNCSQLRRKLKAQKQHLRRAGTKAKRRMVKRNIRDTKRRLQKRGC